MGPSTLLAALTLLVPGPRSSISEGPPPILQPYERSSPDGHWSLSVDPTRRDGGGPGNYRCTHDGKPAWEGSKAWTFWEALITNEGIAAGYAYTEGWRDIPCKGEFHAVILGPDGSVRLDEKQRRKSSGFLHTPPNPIANGLLELDGQDRVVFRISDSDINRHREEWWCYQLPDAKQVYRKRPRDLFPDADARNSVVDAREIRGTRLTLIEWYDVEYPKLGLSLSVHDADWNMVWSLAKLGELNDADEDRTDRQLSLFWQHGSLLDAGGIGTFAVGLPRSKERVSYSVEKNVDGWRVTESGRQPWTLDLDPPHGKRMEDLPLAAVESKGSFMLEQAALPSSPVHDVLEFSFASADQPRFMRYDRERRGYTALRVDLGGRVLSEHAIDPPGHSAAGGMRFWDLGPHSWLATQSDSGPDENTLAWRIDDESGLITRLDAFSCSDIEDVAGLGGDRFVVLATKHEKYTMSTGVFAFDAEGRPLWNLHEDMNSKEPGALFSPKAIAVATDGSVGVLDVIRHTLQCFASDGRYERTFELDKVFGHKAEYPSGLHADMEGGFLVHDFHGDPPLYRLKHDGSVEARIAPRFPDGKIVDGLTRYARIAPGGRLWATDDQRLLRMDEKGVVDLVIGPKVDTDVLADASATAIDLHGRALLQDKSTGAIHVYDGQGKKLFVCRPLPSDFSDLNSIEELVATRDGGVVAPTEGGFIQFGPDGKRQRKLPDLDGELVFSITSDAAYVSRHRAGFTSLGADLKPRTSFDRGPEGRWLTGGAGPSVAADGAVAIVDGRAGPFENPLQPKSLVLFEAGDPKVSRRIELPSDVECYTLALGRRWAVVGGYGKTGVLVRRADGQLLRLQVPTKAEDTSCRFGFDPETDELLVLEGHTALDRFALPAESPR